jgi:hypothetical protein
VPAPLSARRLGLSGILSLVHWVRPELVAEVNLNAGPGP